MKKFFTFLFLLCSCGAPHSVVGVQDVHDTSHSLKELCAPSQIHLAVGRDTSTSMMVSFSSSKRCKHGNKAFVLVGTHPDSLKRVVTSENKQQPNQYNYTSPFTPFKRFTYNSDLYHHVLVDGLKPNTTYYYSCAVMVPPEETNLDTFEDIDGSIQQESRRRLLESNQNKESSSALLLRQSKPYSNRVVIRSKVSSFKTAPPPGQGLGSLKFAFVGDLGSKDASNHTMHHMARDEEIDSILLVGDVSYANTIQTKWDKWFDMHEHIFSKIPLQLAPGNHEIEVDGLTREIFVAYDNRFQMPQVRSVMKGPSHHASYHSGHDLPYDYGNAYYAYTYGAARFIVLSSFTSTSHSSMQYLWLKEELQSMDRAVTPWVFVAFHVPLYNTFGSHNPSKTGQEMKTNMEHLFVSYKVNVVFSGHVHAYMRSKPVAYGKLNKTAPSYVIIGDGGIGHGSTYEHKDVEEWVAKREGKTHGFGTLELLNATHAYWRWVRNVDEHYTKIHDHAHITNQFFL